MTGDPFTAFILAITAVVWVLLGGAAILCVTAAVLQRRRTRDMEALIDATREDMPDVLHVPDEWVKEHGR
jgi:hypothetical protein